MYNKHYENQGFSHRSDKVTKLISVRLSEEEIRILKKLIPDKPLSYVIRSVIHKCNT